MVFENLPMRLWLARQRTWGPICGNGDAASSASTADLAAAGLEGVPWNSTRLAEPAGLGKLMQSIQLNQISERSFFMWRVKL